MIEAPGTTPKKARIVVAHDWLCGLRGGERVLERICALVDRDYEPAGLLTMFDDGQAIGDAVDNWVSGGLLGVSWLNELPGGPRQLRRWLLPLYPAAVRSLGRKLAKIHAQQPVDLVISTSSAAIKGLKTPRGVPHLCYCHSPARYVWSRKEDYSAGRGLAARLRSAGLGLYASQFAAWDRASAANVNKFIANSTYTASEIRRCFGAESVVIHPPVRTDFFTPDASIERGDFWLVVGAVEPYKRVELAIQAAAIAGAHLVVAGSGSELDRVVARSRGKRSDVASVLSGKRDAGPLVEFVGRVKDEALRDLYRRAKALIFPQVEDFGIIAAEAQACGLPVIARAAGGALDIIQNGKTGVLLDEGSPEAIAAAKVPAGIDEACRTNALRFSEKRFDSAIAAEIQSMLANATAGSGAGSRR